jgi:spore germination cell wall hydrolase CwlJ-like protein
VTKRKQSTKATNRKRESRHPKVQWVLPVGIAIAGIAVVLTGLVMQMQKLETVQRELHNLERTTAGYKQDLQNSDLERSRLQGQLEEAHSKVEQLSKTVDANKTLDEKWQTRLESMQSQLERAKKSAEQARAEVAESAKQVAALSAKLDEVNKERHALTERQMADSEIERLKSERDSAQTKTSKDESALKRDRNKPDSAEGKPDRRKIEKGEPEAGSEPEKLKKSSLDAVSPEPSHAAFGPGPDGRDYLIRTLVFEASGETEIGKVAVAYVILNRKRIGRWGHNIEDVVTSPGQFEPWMTRKSEIEGLSRTDPRYLKAADIADAVLAGQIPDPTTGATHFLNPVIVRKRRGGSLPLWADSDGQPIGRHVFYCPECEGSKSTQAAAVEIVGTAGMRKEG